MEKSFAADPPGARRVIQAGDEAAKKNLKIAAGLMCRHSVNRHELIKQIRDGVIGDIQLIRAYRMEPVGPLGPKPPEEDELLWQFRNFVRFYWVSGGLFAEMDIHQIDEICWLKDALPVQAHGIGGRVAGSTDCSQNLDSFAIEWTFADGTKATTSSAMCRVVTTSSSRMSMGRNVPLSSRRPSTWEKYTGIAINASPKTTSRGRHLREAQPVASRMGCTVRCDSPGSTAQRSAPRRGIQPGRHDGPRSRAFGTDHHMDQVMASTFQFCPGIDQMDYTTRLPYRPMRKAVTRLQSRASGQKPDALDRGTHAGSRATGERKGRVDLVHERLGGNRRRADDLRSVDWSAGQGRRHSHRRKGTLGMRLV